MTTGTPPRILCCSSSRWAGYQLPLEPNRQVNDSAGAQSAIVEQMNCAVLVWIWLVAITRKIGITIYTIKQGFLSAHLRGELHSPFVSMNFAQALLRNE